MPRTTDQYAALVKRLDSDTKRLSAIAAAWALCDEEWHRIYLDPGRQGRSADLCREKRFLEREAKGLAISILRARRYRRSFEELLARSSAMSGVEDVGRP